MIFELFLFIFDDLSCFLEDFGSRPGLKRDERDEMSEVRCGPEQEQG